MLEASLLLEREFVHIAFYETSGRLGKIGAVSETHGRSLKFLRASILGTTKLLGLKVIVKRSRSSLFETDGSR